MKEKSKSKSNFQLVSANFRFRAEWKKVTSRAELKIFQLELWLKPARLRLITKRLDDIFSEILLNHCNTH